MFKGIMTTLLLMLMSATSYAASLKIGENVAILAARDAQLNAFSKSVPLNAGEQALIVRFEAPSNPGSPNESQGRITSDAWLLTFDAPLTGELVLTTGIPSTENETRKFAQHPAFTLSDAQGKSLALVSQPLKIAQSTLMTDYSQYLPGQKAVVASQERQVSQPALAAHGEITNAKNEFLKLTPAERKAFLRWALEL